MTWQDLEELPVQQVADPPATSPDPGEKEQASIELEVLRNELMLLSLELEGYKSELTQVTAARRQYSELFDNAPIGYLIVDRLFRVIRINQVASELLLISEADTPNAIFPLRVSVEDRVALKNKIKMVTSGSRVEFSVQLAIENRPKKSITLFMQPVKARDRKQFHCQIAIVDISGRCAAEKQLVKARDYLQHLATHDELTKLPNRRLFNDSLVNIISSARRSGHKLGIAVLDLDQFKFINDTLGHDVGDELLAETAQRLTETVKPKDFVARLAGDEFVLVISDFRHLSDLKAICEKVRLVLSHPYKLGSGTELQVSASIGVSVYPTDGVEVKELVKCADAAMYHAKASGRSRVECFTQDMGRALRHKYRLEEDLRISVENENFETWYQPIYHCKSDSFTSVEVLVRWRHPERGLIQPDDFIHLAEDCGAIESLGFLILEKAFKQQYQMSLAGYGHIAVSINISPYQIVAPGFADKVIELINEHRADANQIEFEVTENALFDEHKEITCIIRRLQSLGIRFSIDDFGTGYSSFSRLAKLPVRKIKIDQTFINGIPEDKDNIAIVKALITMSKDLHICVVAEGVETNKQLDYLRDIECDEIQGFLLAEPMPINKLLSVLQKDKKNYQIADSSPPSQGSDSKPSR